jgi:hypothetical protein
MRTQDGLMLPEAPAYRALVRMRARDWSRQVSPLHVFGGRPLLEAELPASRVTGAPLHLALDLDARDPRLSGLGVRSVRRLAILANYHLDPPRGGALVVRHDDEGRCLVLLDEPTGTSVPGVPRELPQLPVDLEELSDAELAAESIEDMPDGLGTLHQVGGHAVWRGRPQQAPRCPATGEAMRYVATIDGERRFALATGEVQLVFGDGGCLHVYWSDAASISTAVVDRA